MKLKPENKNLASSYAPWGWNIYLHLAWIYGFHVGKYSSPMEHLATVDGSEIHHLGCIKPYK